MKPGIKNALKQIPFLMKAIHAYRLSKYKKSRIPWSVGYNEFKWSFIENLLDSKSIPKEPFGKGLDERVIEYPWVMQWLPDSGSKIWDAGSALNFPLLLERLIKNIVFVTTLYPEMHCQYQDGVSYTYEDLREVCFKDHFFDYIVSISTLEHIGFNNELYNKLNISKKNHINGDYLNTISEFKRVVRRGGEVLLSVPYGKRQVYNNFQVFDYDTVLHLIDIYRPKSFMFEVFKYTTSGWIMADPKKCGDFAYCFPHEIPAADGAAGARAVALLKLIS